MSRIVVPIVEGHGDEWALPILVGRLAPSLVVRRPVRFPKSKRVDPATGAARPAEVSRAVAIAAANIPPGATGLILLVLDTDASCAATLGPSLFAAMRDAHPRARCFAACAVKEFESWIIGGVPEIDEAHPDTAGQPKRRIAEVNQGRYKETADQQKFTARIDPDRLRRRSRSFARLFELLEGFACQK